MNEKELEDRIWNNTESWINFTKLHAKVHGDKQTCFHKTSSMIDTSQLIMRENMKEKLVKRTDFDNTTEFEDIIEFQEKRLKTMIFLKKLIFINLFQIVVKMFLGILYDFLSTFSSCRTNITAFR